MHKLAKLTSIFCAAVFLGIQLVPTSGSSKAATATRQPAQMVNPQVGRILDRSCQDCHSDRTAWPWYSHVAPISWAISKHVKEGREMLDFSEWGNQPPSASERMLICDAVSDGRMPLPEYTMIHRNAKLSKREIELICEWAASPGTPVTSTQLSRGTQGCVSNR
jgi:hypothetical protein